MLGQPKPSPKEACHECPNCDKLSSKLESKDKALKKLQCVVRQLREHIKRRCVEVVPLGHRLPRSEKEKEKAALRVRAKTLELLELRQALAEEDANRTEEREQEEYIDEARFFDRLLDLKAVHDNAAMSDKTAFKILACIQAKGMTGTAIQTMRKAIDDVLEEQFTFEESDDICRLGVAEALAGARERVGIAAGEKVHAVLVGDGRTMGVNALKTTTYICIRLVRTGLGAHGDKHDIMPIAIMNSGEKYGKLEEHMKPICTEMKELQDKGEVEWFLGGDMKWINLVRGISTSQHACAWNCGASAATRGDYAKQFATDGAGPEGVVFGSYKVDDEIRLKKNLFSFIPTDHTMPDFLHLHLRIGERLIHLLCMKLLAAADVAEDMDDPKRTSQATFLREQLSEEFNRHTKRDIEFAKRDGIWQTTPKLTGNLLRPLLKNLDLTKVETFAKPQCATIRERLQGCIREFVAIHDVMNVPDPFGSQAADNKETRQEAAKAFKNRVLLWVHRSCAPSKQLGGYWERKRWKKQRDKPVKVVVIACCFLTLCSQTTEIPGLFPRGKFMAPLCSPPGLPHPGPACRLGRPVRVRWSRVREDEQCAQPHLVPLLVAEGRRVGQANPEADASDSVQATSKAPVWQIKMALPCAGLRRHVQGRQRQDPRKSPGKEAHG
jgi:hypothetical protein